MSDSATPRAARLLCPWDFFRWEYWSGLLFPPLGDLPEPRIKYTPVSPGLQMGFFTHWAIMEAQMLAITGIFQIQIQVLYDTKVSYLTICHYILSLYSVPWIVSIFVAIVKSTWLFIIPFYPNWLCRKYMYVTIRNLPKIYYFK